MFYFMIFGIVFELIFVLIIINKYKIVSRCTVLTNAEVVEVIENSDSNYEIVLKYFVDGIKITANSKVHIVKSNYQPKQIVKIKYNANNEEDFIILDDESMNKEDIRNIIGLISGFLIIIFGYFMDTFNVDSNNQFSIKIDSKVLLMIILLIIMLIFCIKNYINYNKSKKRTMAIKGSIVRFNKYTSWDDDRIVEHYIPVVLYKVEDNVVEREFKKYSKQYKIGDVVGIKYNPKDIYDFEINNGDNYFSSDTFKSSIKKLISILVILFLFIIIF